MNEPGERKRPYIWAWPFLAASGFTAVVFVMAFFLAATKESRFHVKIIGGLSSFAVFVSAGMSLIRALIEWVCKRNKFPWLIVMAAAAILTSEVIVWILFGLTV